MIARIGSPDKNEILIHRYRPATRDGVHDERPECNYGGYHVWVSNDWNEVSCQNCLDTRKACDTMCKT